MVRMGHSPRLQNPETPISARRPGQWPSDAPWARRKIGKLAPASSTQRGPSCLFCVSPSPTKFIYQRGQDHRLPYNPIASHI